MNKISSKFGKRLLALLLCVALVLPMFPQIVHAEAAADTLTSTGTLVADGVVAAGSLTPGSDALGSGNISLVPVTGDEQMIQDAVYAFVSNDKQYMMSHNASASTTGKDTSIGSISLDAAVAGDGTVTIAPEDRDSALWIIHQHRYVPYATSGNWGPTNELPAGSQLYTGFRFAYEADGGASDDKYQMALKFGTSAVAVDQVFFGTLPRKGVSDTDGSYWLSDSTAPNRFLNWGDFVFNSENPDYTLPVDDILQDAEQSDWYTCWDTAMVRLADGSYICFRGRDSANSDKRPDILAMYCDDSGTWGVQRYFTASDGTTPDGAKPITDLFEVDSNGDLQAVKSDELEKLKLRLYKYEINGAAMGYSTYYGESEEAVIAAIQENTTVYDIETAEAIEFADTATLGCCYVDSDTWTVKYVHDDGAQEVLATLTVHIGTLSVQSGLSSQRAVTSKNSSFASTVYVPNVDENDAYVSSTDEPVTFTATFGTQQVVVGVTASMLYDGEGVHIDTAVPNSKGADYTVKLDNTQVGTLKVYIADTTIAQQMPGYPDAGSVVVHKEKTTSQEAFALNGVGSIQLSAAGKPATNGVDLIVMVDLSSSMRYSPEGATAMYNKPYYSSAGTLNTAWTETGWQATRMYAMEESLKEMVTNLQGSGVDVDIAIADFGDLDHYDFDGASLLNNSAYPQIDAIQDQLWNRVLGMSDGTKTRAGWYELANHLNYVLGSNDNGLFENSYYAGGTDSQCRPFNLHEWKYRTVSGVSESMLGNQPSKIHTGDKATIKGAFSDVESLNMTDVITSLRISNSMMLGTNYDLGLEYMYKIAYERKQANIANGEDREIVCIFMSDGTAMQYNYFSGSAYSNAWNDYLAADIDTFAQSPYSWSLEENEDGTLAQFADFHPVVQRLFKGYHKVLCAGNLQWSTDENDKYDSCGCAESDAVGESFLKCLENVWNTMWPGSPYKDLTWQQILELQTVNINNTVINNALWYAIQDFESGLGGETGRFYKYYYGDTSYMYSKGEEHSYGEAMRAELVRVIMKTNDGSYATYSPFSYFYNEEGKNWWAEAIKGDTGKLYPVINKYANGTTHVEGESNPSTYNGDVVNNFSGETTQGLALSGQDYISGFRGLGLDIYSIGFALGTEGDNCITASTMNAVLSRISSGTNSTDGTNKYFFLADDQEALNSALSSVVDDVTEGASRMWFTDTMGEDFDLLTGNTLKDRDGNDIVLDFIPTVSVNLYNADINGKPITLIRTLEKIEFTGDKIAKSTVYNDDGTVATTTADVWDDATDMISGSKIYYNAGTATYNLTLDDSGLTYPLAPETFFWTIGNLPDTVISLEYQVYLTGSMEGKYDDYGITTVHDTNESAVLHYRDVQGNDVTQEPESPTYTWDPLPGTLIVDKTVEAVEGKTDEFTLTLDAYATGSTVELASNKPSDIVLVLDQSSTMYTPAGVNADRIYAKKADYPSTDAYNSAQTELAAMKANGTGYSGAAFNNLYQQALAQEEAGETSQFLEDAKHQGYWLAIHDSYEYMYIVKYDQNSAGDWGWYYICVDQTTRSVEVDTVNPTGSSDTALAAKYGTVIYNNNGKCDLLTNVSYYKTQYAALYDSLRQFVADLREEVVTSGVDHRVAVVGFSSPFYDGWDYYDGTGLYIDGDYFLYDTDYKYTFDGTTYDPDKSHGSSGNPVYDSSTVMTTAEKTKYDGYSIAGKYASALVSVKDDAGYQSVLNSVDAYTANYQQTCPSIGLLIAETIFDARTNAGATINAGTSVANKSFTGSASAGYDYEADVDAEHMSSTYTGDNAEDRDEIIVLFTDGVPTVRCSSDRDLGFSEDKCITGEFWNITAGVDDAIDHAHEAKDKGIQIYTVGTSRNVLDMNLPTTSDTSSDENAPLFLDYVSSDYPDATASLSVTPIVDTAKDEVTGSTVVTTVNTGVADDRGYASYASDEGISVSFSTIYESIVDTVDLDETAVLKDVLSDYFVLSSDQVADIKVYTADYLGKDADGLDTFSDDWVLLDNVTVELTSSEADGRLDTISVSGFDYRENYVGRTQEGELRGKKLIVQVAIKDREGFWGGNNIPTNESTSAVYDSNDEPVAVFPEPQVNIPVAPVIVAKDQVVYYGEDGLDALDHLVDTVAIGGMEVTIDPDTGAFAPNADWMDDFADLSWNGSYCVPASTIVSGTESEDYTFGVVLTPKTDGTTNSSNNPSNMAGTPVGSTGLTSNDTGSVDILVPVITFEDSTIDLGDTTNDAYYESNNCQDGIQWVNKEDPYGTSDLPTTPTEGFTNQPSLTVTYTPVTDEEGCFTQDTPVNVEVYLGTEATEDSKITDEVYFDWIDCDSELHDDNETIVDDVAGDTTHRHKGTTASNEFYIHVTYPLNEDTVVIDFGLYVNIDVLKNDDLPEGTLIGSIANATTVPVPFSKTADTANTYGTMMGGKFGTLTINEGSATVRYTPGGVLVTDPDTGVVTLQLDPGKLEMNEKEVFVYMVQYPGDELTGYCYSTVTVIPATTIYYEDNFVDYSVSTVKDDGTYDTVTGDDTWNTAGTAVDGPQAEDRPGDVANTLDANNIYGFDGAYSNMTTYSYGSAKWVTVQDGKYAEATFTFWGTAFDIISLTDADSGTILVTVDDLNSDREENYMVDTYYGYKYENGEWVVDSQDSDTLYQVPVMKVDMQTYGHYKVTINVSWAFWLDHGQNGGNGTYNFYLDAIRIYNPAAQNADGSITDEVIEGAYNADYEVNPTYEELRNMLISVNDFDALGSEEIKAGAIFIDGNTALSDTENGSYESVQEEDKSYAVSEYMNYGPNNELYLAPDQAVTFDLAGVGSNGRVHIALKSVGAFGGQNDEGITAGNGGATLEIFGVDDDGNKTGLKAGEEKTTLTINTATDLYYDITALAGKTVVIRNAGSEGIISVTNLKTTDTPATLMLFSVSRTSTAQAIAALNEGPAAPIEPADGAISLKYSTASFEDEVKLNIYFDTELAVQPEDMGLITFSSEVADGTLDNAEAVISGAVSNDDGSYSVSTDGIAAKKLGDEVWFRVYARQADGSLVYSKLVSYSPKTYAMNILTGDYDAEMKALVVAMLNYGAEAQLFFGHNVDNLMNKDLTAQQQNLVSGYSAADLKGVGTVDETKVGSFVSNGGFTRKYPTVSFKGAFSINYYFVPEKTVDGHMTFYYWTEDTYSSVSQLTAENADGSRGMTLTGSTYTAVSPEIVAKELDQTIYVAAVYESGGVTYCTGVLAYSLAAYCQEHASNAASGMNAFANAAAIYGCAAKEAFGI